MRWQTGSGLLKGLIVAGCLAQRYRDDIEKEVPEVDVVLGTTAIDRIVEAADDILRKQGHEILTESLDKPATGGEARVLTTGGHYGYLRIAEGCNRASADLTAPFRWSRCWRRRRNWQSAG